MKINSGRSKGIFCILIVLACLGGVWRRKLLPSPYSPEEPKDVVILSSSHSEPVPEKKPFPDDPIQAEEKLHEIREILQSKNDNDPRLDRDFTHLSPLTRQAFKTEYKKLKPELRNERGTLIFLLAREGNPETDSDFFKEVLAEAPCKSLADCNQESPPSEEDVGGELTRAYPQVVLLKLLEADLARSSPSSSTYELLKKATHSPTRLVSQMALQILNHSHTKELL